MNKTLVTGAGGFLGRRVLKATNGVDPGGSKITDLTDRHAIDQMLAKFEPDAVIHLAAVVGGIGANQAQPGRFLYENAKMGIELIESSRIHGVKKMVIAGTVCAYPKELPLPFKEVDLWNGYPEETNAPYGVAKKLLLVMAQGYRQQYGMNIVYLLPVNLYGPGDNFDLESSHVIPAMIRKFVEARENGDNSVTLWGDGTPTREFLYVDDAARAFRLALENYNDPDPVNIGSGEEISIRNLALLIREAVQFDGEIVWDTSKPNGQPRRKLDTSRARERFGFESSIGFEQGLRTTIEWYLENRAKIANGESPGFQGPLA
jgi:GDP-L-fucose synthase